MEQLVRDCNLDCQEDKQLSILEKCMVLILPAKDQNTKNLGYLLLDKVLKRCTPQCIQATQSRLAKRLPELADETNFHGGLFLRRMLLRNPKLGDLHFGVIDRIIMNLIDISIVEDDEKSRKLSIELFSLRYGASNSAKLVKTIDVLMVGSMISAEERADILNLKTIGLKEYKQPLITLLLDVYSSSLECSKYDIMPTQDLLAIFEKGLKFEENILLATLRAISSFCRNTGSGAIPIISLLVSSLIGLLNSPSSQLFHTMTVISKMYGSSSSLHGHFYILFSSIKQPLHCHVYGSAASELLASIVRSSFPLIKHEVLLSVQRNVCEMAMRFPSSPVYHILLKAFLSISHDWIPVPVQVARSVISHCSATESCDELKDLCELITRPRIQNLSLACMSRKTATSARAADNSAESAMNGVDDFSNKIAAVLNDIATQEDNDEDVDDSILAIEEQTKTEDTVIPETRKVEEVAIISAPKRPAVIKPTIPTPTKKVKKSTNNAALPATILKDGEASVDDIMGMFCPS